MYRSIIVPSLEFLCKIVFEKTVGQNFGRKEERKQERKKERKKELPEKQYDCVGTQS